MKLHEPGAFKVKPEYLTMEVVNTGVLVIRSCSEPKSVLLLSLLTQSSNIFYKQHMVWFLFHSFVEGMVVLSIQCSIKAVI